MGKVIKILLSTVSAVVLTLIILPIAISLLLSVQSIQDVIVKKATQILTTKLETEVKIDRLRLRIFNRLTVEGLYIADYQGDTMLYAGSLVVPIKAISLIDFGLSLGTVELRDTKFYLMQDSTGKTALAQIIQKLNNPNKSKSSSPFNLTASGLIVENLAFKHRKLNVEPRIYGVNFSDIDVSNFKFKANNISVIEDSISLSIESASFREKCGLILNNLQSKSFVISSTTLALERGRIVTPDSDLSMLYFGFDYKSWDDYSDFINKVVMRAQIINTTAAASTIAFFAPSLNKWKGVYRNISGEVSGTVADMRGEMSSIEFGTTKLGTKFAISGLPDITHTKFMFDVGYLETNSADVEFISKDITGKSLDSFSKYLKCAGIIKFTGKFDGLITDFVAEGKLNVAQGETALKLNIRPLNNNITGFVGNVTCSDFNIGSLLEVNKLEKITLSAAVSGDIGGKDLKINTDAKLLKLRYNDYTYDSIALTGEFVNRKFVGAISSNDENLNFDFNGELDFADSIPAYNFDLKLYNADISKLGFDKRDTISQFHCNVVAKGSGSTLDNINGNITIDDLLYINAVDTVKTERIHLVATNNSDSKLLGLYSSFADVEFRGRLSYSNMISYFKNTLVKYLPAISNTNVAGQDASKQSGSSGKADEPKLISTASSPVTSSTPSSIDSYYLFSMNVKEANNVAGIFLPGLQLAEGTKLTFLFNPISDVFALTLNSEYIERNNFFVSNLNVNSRNQGDSISLFLQSDDIYFSGLYLPQFSVIGGARENKINLATRFSNKENGASALISTMSTLSLNQQNGLPQLKMKFFPSSISSGQQEWRIGADEIMYDTTKIDIRNFSITSAGQSLTINGVASKSAEDTLRLRLGNFDLTPLSHITDRMGYNISGITNGYANVASVLKGAYLYSNITFDDVKINNTTLPNSVFESNWDFTTEQARLQFSDKATKETFIKGYYRPNDKRYLIDMKFDSLPLNLLDPLLSSVLKNSKGYAQADIQLTNPDNKPLFNGVVHVPELSTTIDYTNVQYSLKDVTLDLKDNNLVMRHTSVYDQERHSAGLDFSFNFSNFKNLMYDLKIRPENMLVLNTTVKDNSLFYGKVYGSGLASIKGDKNGLNMDINATTAGDSKFFMPLSSGSTISKADFILFESPEEHNAKEDLSNMSRRKQILLSRDKSKIASATKTNMNINLTITAKPNAEIQLVIDPTTGDLLRGRGNGTLVMTINPTRNIFTIYGDYDIADGSYYFNFQDIVSRKFTIQSGSSLQWTGDPLDAMLNITAIYRLKASLAPLLKTNDKSLRGKTNVDCLIKLSNRLTQPEIQLDVQVPNADPEVQSLVAHEMNTQEMRTMQFVYLLTLQSFYSENSNTSQNLNIGAQGAAAIGFDFLSAQLSSLVSNDRFGFAPKYTPKTELNSDEVGTSFYGEIIENKLILEGDVNYDTGNNLTRTANSLTGEAYVSWLLDQAGDFKIQAFTRTIDRYDENQGLQESGIGIFYREKFNSFRDLVAIFKERFSKLTRARKKVNKEVTESVENTKESVK